ncbi:hypothetical protein [Arthrobacter sp. CC3]|uniref:hypothetical protein n=1 Tax=Arthrobacter sp. CC3 TaxID=3029185 RepID=UPI0032645996
MAELFVEILRRYLSQISRRGIRTRDRGCSHIPANESPVIGPGIIRAMRQSLNDDTPQSALLGS